MHKITTRELYTTRDPEKTDEQVCLNFECQNFNPFCFHFSTPVLLYEHRRLRVGEYGWSFLVLVGGGCCLVGVICCCWGFFFCCFLCEKTQPVSLIPWNLLSYQEHMRTNWWIHLWFISAYSHPASSRSPYHFSWPIVTLALNQGAHRIPQLCWGVKVRPIKRTTKLHWGCNNDSSNSPMTFNMWTQTYFVACSKSKKHITKCNWKVRT